MSGESRHEPQGSLREALAGGLVHLGLPMDEAGRARLLAFLELLARWNRVYNLTAVTDPAEMLVLHVLDSFSIAGDLRGPRVLDVGTGAGLPGVPLSIVHPQWEFVLLDSSAKKVRFLTQAAAELDLRNVVPVQARVERYEAAPFDTIVGRAFASLARWLAAVRHLAYPGTRLLAMKGRFPGEELTGLPPGFLVDEVRPVRVPGLDAQRHVVRLTANEPVGAAP
jgi:16S rRNA (guanine527-N7)-methyltransferase